jgi:exopolysaccharide biosynthesis WecB/TagA/CpsF family protein
VFLPASIWRLNRSILPRMLNAPGRKETMLSASPEATYGSSQIGMFRPRGHLALLHMIINNVTIIDTVADEAALIARITKAEAPLVISFVNQHSLNLAAASSDFASCLIHSEILLRDGIGTAMCMWTLGRTCGRNMNGTDFIPHLVAAFAGRRVALFGTVDPWTTQAAAALQSFGCEIVSTMDGFRPDADYLGETIAKSPDLVILAMGNPRQEAVARLVATAIKRPIVIVNGGAIADFLANRFQRAPMYLRRAHCEWAFRLFLEPRRLWRRYCLGAFSFAWHIFRLRMTL